MTTKTESIHVTRLRKLHEKNVDTSIHQTIWQTFDFKPANYIEYQTISKTFEGIQIGGYHLVVVCVKWKLRDVLDKSQQLITGRWVDDSEIGGYGEWHERDSYIAYAYRTGTDYDRINELSWAGQFATFYGTCVSDSKEKTIKLARKKIDMYNLVLNNLGELMQLSQGYEYRNNMVNPYNVTIGDKVWIQAFGRMRQGIIVGSVGSRFVVGYVTPSNQSDLKYKILPIAGLWIKP